MISVIFIGLPHEPIKQFVDHVSDEIGFSSETFVVHPNMWQQYPFKVMPSTTY